jgi:hypothetical protein
MSQEKPAKFRSTKFYCSYSPRFICFQSLWLRSFAQEHPIYKNLLPTTHQKIFRPEEVSALQQARCGSLGSRPPRRSTSTVTMLNAPSEKLPPKMLSRWSKQRRHSPFRGPKDAFLLRIVSEETNRREVLVEDLVPTLGSIVQRDLCYVRS